ncbi:DUF748 domain-containing protein [Pontibacter akesuensis]|uniref:DUF748 domain-containing protein n=1 Tax=Pontibacter akesuensis TaxID=388950 RepID=A0A1I7IBK5_9BACT|nr:DUF748 domain-containing protein [Pontibacter akesuensis]GHA66197.1 hypothetical protein GCM10007389_19040 [Pontibacter akesuensis]SFU70268.1 protein of unknown function [Pontibacter akesuensis]
MYFKKPYKIILAVVVVLVIFRIALPYLVKDYVNKVLDELPGYTGHVNDIDLHLYRGAYTIKGLVLVEEKGNPKYPFLHIAQTDLSLEWKSLFKGEIVGEVIMERPVMNIVETPAAQSAAREPTQEDWTQVVTDLMPITINRYVIHNGRLAYLDFSASPDVKLHIDNMQLVALNLANVENETTALPSTIHVTGKSVGGGTLKSDMRANLLKEMPDLDVNMQLTQVDVTSLNSFIKANAGFDVEQGKLDMYSKVRLTDGQLNGYMKPFLENIKVLSWKKDKKEDGFLHAAKEAVIGLFAEAVENQEKDQIATQVPISGNINNPDTDNWRTFVNVLRHAFVDAFNKSLENEASRGNKKQEKKD